MHQNQLGLTEDLLFNTYLVSSPRETEVFSPFPVHMERAAFEKMVESAQVIDRIVHRIIHRFIANPSAPLFDIGVFPFQKEILSLEIPLTPFFWSRYDAFLREDGGIFFCEFNYDKPCAQREILISDTMDPVGNPNGGFVAAFQQGVLNACEKMKARGKEPHVGILVEPTRPEETHLAFLYQQVLGAVGIPALISGGNNLRVMGDAIQAFGEPVNILLRQYPAEHLGELPDIEAILKLASSGEIILMNDPRAILGQAKSLFSYLWHLVETPDGFLSPEEVQVIRDTIPHTRPYSALFTDKLIQEKDASVIKAVYGRYSEDVYIGIMHTPEEWLSVLAYVEASREDYIIQEFCPILKEDVVRFNGKTFEAIIAHGNYGVYLTEGNVSGTCVRWSTDYLSSEEIVWSSPVGVRNAALRVQPIGGSDRQDIWTDIHESAAFEDGYTGGYTGPYETFSLSALMMPPTLFEEMREASEALSELFERTTRYVQTRPELFCPVLGIDPALEQLVAQSLSNSSVLLGRMDWVVDIQGSLKLLEFNAETPGGLVESCCLGSRIKERLHPGGTDPNTAMGAMIRGSFEKILKDYGKHRDIRRIGLVTDAYHEDWYNTAFVYDLVKDLPYDCVLGTIHGLDVQGDQLTLEGKPLDALYRYYPLDWFADTGHFSRMIPALEKGTLSINPPATLISQSKAFFALVWELYRNGFYRPDEAALIETYLPKTALSPKQLNTADYCIKSYFGREGDSVHFSYAGDPGPGDWVYQERIPVAPVAMAVHGTTGSHTRTLFPVIGSYLTGNRFAGILTRLGGRVTDHWAFYLPTYIETEPFPLHENNERKVINETLSGNQ